MTIRDLVVVDLRVMREQIPARRREVAITRAITA
jgi:hypothetical protein